MKIKKLLNELSEINLNFGILKKTKRICEKNSDFGEALSNLQEMFI